MSLAPGTNLGPYRIVALLGAGGMGEVYRAEDPKLGREVAIKVLPETLAADPERLRRFEREARALAALAHPGILDIHDFGTHEGAPYLVMELLEGETLRRRLEEGGRLPARRVAELGAEVAKGLAAAHEKGILHRDLKPENLFLCRDGRVKILDFGLAKLQEGPVGPDSATWMSLSGSGQVVGTAGYMSPEQVQGRDLDARSDLFSLGVVLWEALAGGSPFRRDTLVETLHAILKEEAPELDPSLGVPDGLRRVVDRCLAKEPEARFHSAHDLVFALESLSSGPALPPIPRRRGRIPAMAAGIGALALGLAVLGMLGWAWLPRRSPPAFQRLTYREGVIPAARFTPDGREVLFSADWEVRGSFSLFGLKLGQRDLKSLGIRDAILQGVAPTGEIALISGLSPYSFFGWRGRLGIARIGALAPRLEAGEILSADLAPDGTVAVARRTALGRYQLEYPPGRVRLDRGSDLMDLRFSRDGRKLAFIEHDQRGESMGRVGLVDLASGEVRMLTRPFSHVIGLAWHGEEVWFTAADRGAQKALWAVTPQGRIRLVFQGPADLTLLDVAPDGRVLLNSEALDPRLYLVKEGTPGPRELTDGWYPLPLGLTADGSRFLYSDQTLAQPPFYDMYLQPLPEGPALYLGPGICNAAISPEGTRIVSFQAVPPHPVILPVGPGEVRHLPSHGIVDYPEFVAWRPDGRAFHFTANREGKAPRAYLQDASTGALQPLGPEGTTAVHFMPDGRRMLARIGDDWRLVDPARPEGPLEPVKGLDRLDRRREQILGWDREGRRILLCLIEPGAIGVHRLDPRTGRRSVWTRFPTPGMDLRRWGAPPRLSADGKTLLFSTLTWGSRLYLVEGLE